MKKYLMVISFSLITIVVKAQQTVPINVKSTKLIADSDLIFVAVQQSAEFPGGPNEFKKYVIKNLRYSDKNNQLEGNIFATFVVERNGTLSDIKILRGLSSDADTEVIRILKASPKWIPGKQNGFIIRQQYTVPVLFGKVQK